MFKFVKIVLIGGMILCVLSLNACTFSGSASENDITTNPFTGNWQGHGIDSEGNEFTFAAKVIALDGDKYKILILNSIDTTEDPMHVMDGVLKNGQFTYTADEGIYTGAGTLDGDTFEGFYKGPVDGTFKMQRIK